VPGMRIALKQMYRGKAKGHGRGSGDTAVELYCAACRYGAPPSLVGFMGYVPCWGHHSTEDGESVFLVMRSEGIRPGLISLEDAYGNAKSGPHGSIEIAKGAYYQILAQSLGLHRVADLSSEQLRRNAIKAFVFQTLQTLRHLFENQLAPGDLRTQGNYLLTHGRGIKLVDMEKGWVGTPELGRRNTL